MTAQELADIIRQHDFFRFADKAMERLILAEAAVALPTIPKLVQDALLRAQAATRPTDPPLAELMGCDIADRYGADADLAEEMSAALDRAMRNLVA